MAYQELPNQQSFIRDSFPVLASTASSPVFTTNLQHSLVSSRPLQEIRIIDWQPQTFVVNHSNQHFLVSKIDERGGQPVAFPSASRPEWLPSDNYPAMMINGYPSTFHQCAPSVQRLSQDYFTLGNQPQPMSEHPRWNQQRNLRMSTTRYSSERGGYHDHGQLLLPPTTFPSFAPTGCDAVSMSMINPSSVTSTLLDGPWQSASTQAPDSPNQKKNAAALVVWSGNTFSDSNSGSSDYDIDSITVDQEPNEQEERSRPNTLSLQVSRNHSISSVYSLQSASDTYASAIPSSPRRTSPDHDSCCELAVQEHIAVESHVETKPPKRNVKRQVTSTAATSRPRKAPNMHIPLPIIEVGLTKKTRGRVATTNPNLVDSNLVHICPIPGCRSCFSRLEHVKRHMRGVHSMEKPFRCTWPECMREFTRRDNLKTHYRAAHRTEPPLILVPHYPEAGE